MTRNGEDVTGNCCPWQGKRIKPGSRVALNLQSRSPKAVIASQNRTPLIFGRAICRTTIPRLALFHINFFLSRLLENHGTGSIGKFCRRQIMCIVQANSTLEKKKNSCALAIVLSLLL